MGDLFLACKPEGKGDGVEGGWMDCSYVRNDARERQTSFADNISWD